jgi:hypothetical protein
MPSRLPLDNDPHTVLVDDIYGAMLAQQTWHLTSGGFVRGVYKLCFGGRSYLFDIVGQLAGIARQPGQIFQSKNGDNLDARAANLTLINVPKRDPRRSADVIRLHRQLKGQK